MNADDPVLTSRDEIPDPEFRARLEWQLRTAARRAERFAPGRAPASFALLRRAAAILLAMVLGASGLLAAQHYARERAAELLAEQIRVRAEIAALRESAAARELEQRERAARAGIESSTSVAQARGRHAQLAGEARRLELDRIEVTQTGREPDHRLSAPLVGGRDLVAERLRLDREQIAVRAEGAREREALLEKLAQQGLASQDELEDARAELALLAEDERVVERKLALRAQCLHGALSAGEAHWAALREEAAARVARAERELAVLERRAAHAEQLRLAAVITQRESDEARRRADEAAKTVELARLERELVEARAAEDR